MANMGRDRQSRLSQSAFPKRVVLASSFHPLRPVRSPKKRGRMRRALIARVKSASVANPQHVDHAQLYRRSNAKAIGRHRQPRCRAKHGLRRAVDKAGAAGSKPRTMQSFGTGTAHALGDPSRRGLAHPSVDSVPVDVREKCLDVLGAFRWLIV